METLSALSAICAGNSSVNGQSLMFSLICAWINDWVNHGDAGVLRRHRAHYDVTVMTEYDSVALFNPAWVCARRTMNMQAIRIEQWLVHSPTKDSDTQIIVSFWRRCDGFSAPNERISIKMTVVYCINFCGWYSQNDRSIPKRLTTYKLNYVNDVIRSTLSEVAIPWQPMYFDQKMTRIDSLFSQYSITINP